MGNFQAFKWTSERDNRKPATVNKPPATAPQNDEDTHNDDDTDKESLEEEEQRHVGRKTWSESSYATPMYNSHYDALHGVPRYGRTPNHVLTDNVKTLLRYDEDAARVWPYDAEDVQPKIGSPLSATNMAVHCQFLQQCGENGQNIHVKPSCHMTKFVNDMTKTYKRFKMYGQTGIAPPF